MRSRLLFAVSLTMLASAVVTGCGGAKKEELEPSPYKAGNYPGHLKIGNPYDIDGRTYVPAHDPDYVEEGMASWYGPGFNGRATANGERFDQYAMTAAHRTLPLPSMVRVTNLENGKIEILRVNDRGPFKKDRIIDLSKGSAEKLGVISKGTAAVRVEFLPNETRAMIAQLIRSNQLTATEETLAQLDLRGVVHENAMELAADVAPASTGFGLISSAVAAEPAVVSRAPLSPVASRELEVPTADSARREEMRMARLERAPAQRQAPASYEQGGVVPSVMPATRDGMPVVTEPPLSAPQPPVMNMRAPEANSPANLQILPDSMPNDAPLYQPLETPQMPEPQASSPRYERETVVASTSAGAAIPSGIFIQAGSFSQAQNAHDLSQRLNSVGRTIVKPVEISGRTWYRVQVGPLANMSTANSALLSLQGMGIRDARVVKD